MYLKNGSKDNLEKFCYERFETNSSVLIDRNTIFFCKICTLKIQILRFGWRTAAVVPELKEELDTFKSPDFIQLVNRLNELEREYDYLANYSSYHQRCQSIILERQNLKEWN
jgi:hypothetical protein